MLSKGVTLRALELVEAVALTGSVAEAAAKGGISLPAASQQISNIETSLGVVLFDRAHRPLKLTPAGRLFLHRISGALEQIRHATAELAVPDIAHLTDLRLGLIDDFDIEITPDLVLSLARALQNCNFRLSTRPSHQIMSLLAERKLDLGVAATSETQVTHTRQYMLLREPFVLVVPHGFALPRGSEREALSTIPFLRYDRSQLLGRQIESHLARHRFVPPERFEIDSNQSIMALVASGSGFSITTPLALVRAKAFLSNVRVAPLPLEPLSREIALFVREDLPGGIGADMAASLRAIMRTRLVEPVMEIAPWLESAFRVIDD